MPCSRPSVLPLAAVLGGLLLFCFFSGSSSSRTLALSNCSMVCDIATSQACAVDAVRHKVVVSKAEVELRHARRSFRKQPLHAGSNTKHVQSDDIDGFVTLWSRGLGNRKILRDDCSSSGTDYGVSSSQPLCRAQTVATKPTELIVSCTDLRQHAQLLQATVRYTTTSHTH